MRAKEPAGIRFGRFEVLNTVTRRGGGGVLVEAAMDPHGPRSRSVALTLLDPGLVAADRIQKGWATASRASHPLLPVPVDFGVEGGIPYVAAPWLDGWTLSEVAQAMGASGRALTGRIVASIGREVADALDALTHCANSPDHPVSLVHGRIRPGRVLVTRDGHLHLLGFAVTPDAVTFDPRAEAFQPADQPITAATDVCALARVLTWSFETPTARPGSLRAEEPELAAVLDEVAAPDPEDRRSARWLATRLDRYLAARGGPLVAAEWRVLLEELPLVSTATEAERQAAAVRLTALLAGGAAGAAAADAAAGENDPTVEQTAADERTEERSPGPAAAPPGRAPFPWPGLAGSLAAAVLAALLTHAALGIGPASPSAALAATPAASPAPVQPTPEPPPAPDAPAVTPREGRPPGKRPVAAAEAPAPRGAAQLVVRAAPDGVVYVDGKPVGTTPLTTSEVPAGPHVVEVRLGGHDTARREVVLGRGPTELSFQLQREAAGTGRLTIRSTPPSVVYLDGAPLGTTPIESTEVTAALHVVEFKLGGHRPERREVRVGKNGASVVDATLTPTR